MSILFYSNDSIIQNLTQSDPWLLNRGIEGYLDLLRSGVLTPLDLKTGKEKICQSDNTIKVSVSKPIIISELERLVKKTEKSEIIDLTNLKNELTDYDWKFRLIRATVGERQRVCSIGPGKGVELLGLRLHFPESEIFYIDRIDQVDPEVRKLASAKRIEIDLMANNVPAGNFFDLIFSNHSLEHFSDLTGVLTRIKNLSIPNGYVVNVIPRDLDKELPLTSLLTILLNEPDKLTLFDGPLIDIGHCLKADESIVNYISAIPGYGGTTAFESIDASTNKKIFKHASKLVGKCLYAPLYRCLRNIYKIVYKLMSSNHPSRSRYELEISILRRIPFNVRNFGRMAQNRDNKEMLLLTKLN